MGMRPVCPVCESTEYVLRQGQYFCRMCNTQSQELGTEAVMDEETIPFGCQGRTDAITLRGRNKGKGKKRSLCGGMRWGTAEGFSWVLRGWVEQLNSMGVDVEIAALQLWTIYLRELRMGFEKRGEEGMIGIQNLAYREKWNLIGGPPELMSMQTLAAAKKRRLAMEQEGMEEDEDLEGLESIQERKRRRKKQRQFFKSVSNADSGSEMDPKSPSAPSSVGGGGSTSGAELEEYSESGHMTDPTLLSQVMERFTTGYAPHQKSPMNRNTDFRQSGVDNASIIPSNLNIRQLAALLTLAVVARSHSSVTISDMVRLFNSEALSWKSALTFLPQAYTPSSFIESRKFRGQHVLTTKMLSVLVFRLASFLHHPSTYNTGPKQLNLVYSLPTLKSHKRSPFTFNSVLARFLKDLSLPSVLCKDIYTTFKRLHLTNMSATLQAYTPGINSWNTNMFPIVSKRILALILFSLKYHCGLDDQYEVYMSHNITKMATLTNGANFHYFDLLSWIRLSKFRLDQLMSTNHCIRDQFQVLAHVGTPDLVLPSLISKLRDEDKHHQTPGGLNKPPDKKFSDLTKLMSDLTVTVKPSGNTSLSLEPLLDQSKLLLQNAAVKPTVKKSVEKLLEMTDADMRLCYSLENNTLSKILHRNHGVSIDSEFRKKSEKKMSLAKNWVATLDLNNRMGSHFNLAGINCEDQFKIQSRVQFLEMIKSGRTRKSKYSVPHPKSRPGRFFKVTKSYWFAHPFSVKKEVEKTDEALDQMLDTMPSNFAWILKYFSCYAQLPPLDLLEELNEIEKLFLMLDPDYFGFPRKLKRKTERFLPWKGRKVQVAKNKTDKVVTDPLGR